MIQGKSQQRVLSNNASDSSLMEQEHEANVPKQKEPDQRAAVVSKRPLDERGGAHHALVSCESVQLSHNMGSRTPRCVSRPEAVVDQPRANEMRERCQPRAGCAFTGTGARPDCQGGRGTGTRHLHHQYLKEKR